MKVTFLGTGTSQGVPIIGCECKVCKSNDARDKRLRASVLFEVDDHIIGIDSGPDFRQQMLRANVKRLDAILFTHGHKDHVAGLDDVRAYNYILQRPMKIYAEENVVDIIKREFSYVFEEDKYPGVPEIDVHFIDEHPFSIDDLKITPIRCMHYKLPVLGFRIKDVAYITDTNYIPDAEIEKLQGLKVLIITALRKREHISHYNLEEALQLIKKLNPDKAFLTHVSHQMGLTSEVSKELPDGVEFAYDELTIEVD